MYVQERLTLSSSSGRSSCITPAFCMTSMFCGLVAASATAWTKVTRAFWYASKCWSTDTPLMVLPLPPPPQLLSGTANSSLVFCLFLLPVYDHSSACIGQAGSSNQCARYWQQGTDNLSVASLLEASPLPLCVRFPGEAVGCGGRDGLSRCVARRMLGLPRLDVEKSRRNGKNAAELTSGPSVWVGLGCRHSSKNKRAAVRRPTLGRLKPCLEARRVAGIG